MARTILTASGQNTTVYTVPSGKVAKVIITRVDNWGSNYSINIGAFTIFNMTGVNVWSAYGNILPGATSTNSFIMTTPGYIMCSSQINTRLDAYKINLKSEHILIAGESVYMQNGTLYITVIEEDV